MIHSSSLLATKELEPFLKTDERKIAAIDDFYWKAFDYLQINEVGGDYLEFGCGGGMISFRLAAKYRSYMYKNPNLPLPHMFAFDSFEGLPKIPKSEAHPYWEPHSFAVSVEDFRAALASHGLGIVDYTVIPGFYNKTLDPNLPSNFGIKQSCFAFIDCDLYSSTKSVLRFLTSTLHDGAILAFDDWNCYRSNPNRGQKLAFQEYCAQHREFNFSEFLTFGWHGKSFIVSPS